MKHDLEKYVATLNPSLQRIYKQCDDFVLCAADTLDDEFQIAAQVLNLFTHYALRRE